MSNDIQALLARARDEVDEIDIETLMGAADRFLIVDVREPEEFAAGNIDNSINVPLSTLIPGLGPATDPGDLTALTDESRRICVYCQSGGRSLIAAYALSQVGISGAVSLAGGILEWLERSP